MSLQAMENKVTGPRLDCIVTVVDALRMLTDFEGGKALAASDIEQEVFYAELDLRHRR